MIEADFKVLQSEFKKKNPQVRESVETALAWLAQVKQQQNAGGAVAQQDKIQNQPIEILEPLRLMFEQKINKTYPMAMNLLQKITQVFVVVEHGTLLLILGILKEASMEILDEMTEIRILQMLLTFLDPHTIQLSKEFVTLVMQCCFQMMDTKSLAVKSTIQATLKQLFTIILERFVEHCKTAIPLQKQHDIFSSKKHGVQLSQDEVAEICDLLRSNFQGGDSIYIVVREIIQNLAFTVLMFEQRTGSKKLQAPSQGSEQSLNFKPSAYSTSIVLDLINLCLSMTNETFRFCPDILSIFELQIVPTIEPLLSQKSSPQSSIGMRLMKCSTLIINNLGVGLNLLRTILADAESFTHQSKDGSLSVNLNWRCLIAFECMQIVISNPSLSELFANSSLSIGAPVLIQIFECYIKAAKAIEHSKDPLINSSTQQASSQSQHQTRLSQRGLYQSTQKINKVINSQNLDGEISPPTFLQIQRIIIESICTFADNFVYVFSSVGIKLGTPSSSRGKTKDADDENPNIVKCKRMLTLCWKPLLEALQKLIRTTPDESNIQMLLKAFQSCIGACGSAYCYEARDAFLQALCSECITVSSSGSKSDSASGGHSARDNTQTGRKSLASAVNVKPVSGDDQITITERNIPICKTFFNIAHCLCHVLDVKSWFLIFETMQKIENVINKKLQIHGFVQRKDRPTFNQDGNQLIINFEELKKKVDDKMLRFNIVERSQNQAKKPGQHHSRLSICGSSQVNVASRPSFNMLSPGAESQELNDANMQASIQIPALSITSDRISIQSQYKQSHGNPFEELKDVGAAASQSQANARSLDPLLADLHMLQESFDSLFTSTLLFDMQSLAELICALAQLTVGVLENFHSPIFASQNARTSTEGEILAQINTFAMSRLVETALVNVSRIDNIWKIIVAHFDILSNCQVLAIRQLTIEALQTIVLAIFAHKKTLQPQQQQVLNKSRSTGHPLDKSLGEQNQRKRTLSQNLQENVAEEDASFEEENKGEALSEVASEHDVLSSQNTSQASNDEKKEPTRSGRSVKTSDESWQNNTWQYTVLVPLAEQLKSNHNSDKLSVIKGFEKIIQTCGQQIKNEGWRIIIVTISKSLEHESEQVVACGFRCLKLVVSNYINRLSQQNFVTVLNAIHMYASNGGSNINNNLIAIGMFQNVADYASKQISNSGNQAPAQDTGLSVVQQKATAINYEKIWEILFERIHSLGSNKRAEVRKATVHTLENIVMTHGASLQAGQIWPKILNDTVLGMLKSCVEKYSQNAGGPITRASIGLQDAGIDPHKTGPDGMIAPTPTFFGSSASQTQGKAQPKMQFDDATVTKALKQNDSQWEETCTVLVQTSCRTLKKFFSVAKDKGSTTSAAKVQELAQEFWIELTDSMNLMLSVGSSDVCIQIFKALLGFLADPDCQQLFLSCEDETSTFMSAVVDYLQTEQENFQAQKTDRNKTIKLLKICPIVIETLQKLYSKQTLSQLEERGSAQQESPNALHKIVEKSFCKNILNLLEMIVSTSKAAESLQSFGTNKLLSEERTVFDFIESLNDFFFLNAETQSLYLDFLFKFTEYKGEQRQEAFIKRSLAIFYVALLRGRVQKSIIRDLLPRLIDRMKDLINLRYDNQACVSLVFQAKGQQTLFLTIGLYFIHITSFLINPKQFQARLQIHDAQNNANQLGGGTTPTNQSSEEQKKSEKKTSLVNETGCTGGHQKLAASSNSNNQTNQVTNAQSMMLAPASVNEKDLLFSESLEFKPCLAAEVRPEEYVELNIRQLVWETVMEALQTTILFDAVKIQDHNKSIQQEVVKASQELEMQAMNFILNCLLPNSTLAGQASSETQKVLEQSLVNIIDRGCQGSGSFAPSSNNGSGSHYNLSRYCFNNMFELCRYQTPTDHTATSSDASHQRTDSQEALQANINEIKLKIASIATPILINRCKQTLKRFIKDESKVGSVGLPKSRISEVVFILEKLKDLDCYPQHQIQRISNLSQNSSHNNNNNQRTSNASAVSMTGGNFKKNHLIELMPILSELILRNEQPIKESLRSIFLEISGALNDNSRAIQEAVQHDFNGSVGNAEFSNRVSTGAAEEGNRGSSGGEDE